MRTLLRVSEPGIPICAIFYTIIGLPEISSNEREKKLYMFKGNIDLSLRCVMS